MASLQQWDHERAADGPAALPADLRKLRERFLAEFPLESARIELLARVPAAFRHLLAMKLELQRADALPRRYRDIAEATLRAGNALAFAQGDAVDRVVAAYAGAESNHAAACQLVGLRRYFTESQVIELTLIVTQAHAFLAFDAVLSTAPER